MKKQRSLDYSGSPYEIVFESSKPNQGKVMKKNIETKQVISESKRIEKAAPQMLEILNRIVLLSRLDCKNPECMCVHRDVLRTAKQIIAQAEGKRK